MDLLITSDRRKARKHLLHEGSTKPQVFSVSVFQKGSNFTKKMYELEYSETEYLETESLAFEKFESFTYRV